jgi:DNA polymerase-3 subunit gamma/tau
MTLLRMLAFRPLAEGTPAAGRTAQGASASPARSDRPVSREPGIVPAGSGPAGARPAGAVAAMAIVPGAGGGGLEVPGGAPASSRAASPWTGDDWPSVVAALELSGLSRQLAAHCALVQRDGAVIRLALDPRNQHVRTAAAADRLAQALSRHLGETIRVEIEVGEPAAETPARAEERQARDHLVAARESLEADPTVRALKEKFGATLRTDTVRPHR